MENHVKLYEKGGKRMLEPNWEYSNPIANVEERKVYEFVKRIMDLVGSILGLIVLSPIFLVLAVSWYT